MSKRRLVPQNQTDFLPFFRGISVLDKSPQPSQDFGDYSDILPPKIGCKFSEGFLTDSEGHLLGIGRAPRGPSGYRELNEDAREAIAHQDHEGYLACLLEGAPKEDPILAEMSEKDRKIIEKKQKRLDAQEEHAEKYANAQKDYNSFLDKVQAIGFEWRNIPRLRATIQQYFPKTRTDLRALNPKAFVHYLNERVSEANHATERDLPRWHRERHVNVEAYSKYLEASKEINPQGDTHRKVSALEQCFPHRFGEHGTQPIRNYLSTPQKIDHIYLDMVAQAIETTKPYQSQVQLA